MKKAKVIIPLILIIAVAFFGVSFAFVNGFISLGGKSINEAIGEIETKFSDEFCLVTQNCETTVPYDTGKEYLKVGKYNIPFTDREVSFNYTLNVKAGVRDLTQADIKPKGTDTILIVLPNVEILNDENDMGTVSNAKQKNNPINPVDISQIEEIKKGLNDVAIDRAVEEGILVRAKNHTEEALKEELKDILGDKYLLEIEWK